MDTSMLHLSKNEVELAMHGFLKKESINSISRFEKLRFRPQQKSKINIPLSRMVSLPMVRLFLKNNVMNLGAHFVACGYMDEMDFLYCF